MSASKMFNTELRAEAERWPNQYHADIHYINDRRGFNWATPLPARATSLLGQVCTPPVPSCMSACLLALLPRALLASRNGAKPGLSIHKSYVARVLHTRGVSAWWPQRRVVGTLRLRLSLPGWHSTQSSKVAGLTSKPGNPRNGSGCHCMLKRTTLWLALAAAPLVRPRTLGHYRFVRMSTKERKEGETPQEQSSRRSWTNQLQNPSL